MTNLEQHLTAADDFQTKWERLRELEHLCEDGVRLNEAEAAELRGLMNWEDEQWRNECDV